MVDKENQWDDIDYTDQEDIKDQEYDESGYNSDEEYVDNSDEYSEKDYQTYNDYDDDDNEEYEDDSKELSRKKSSQLPLLVIALLLFGLAGFLYVNKMSANKNLTDTEIAGNSESSMEQVLVSNNSESTESLADEFFEQAGGDSSEMMSIDFNDNGDAQVTTKGEDGNIVATVSDKDSSVSEGNDLFQSSGSDLDFDSSKENNDIIISYDKVARENPFKPPLYSKTGSLNNVMIDNTQFEIIEPPVTSVPDENLTKLLQTQISGILYDDVSPSAIVNLNGVDTFVKVGDTISGYTIQEITNDKVQINYKNNSYVASVGELFTRGVLEKQRAVANLEKKFAGRYKDNNN